ncbi:NAD(P)-dependent oxidoreductase [Solicola gregarius]|uniref:NAD(P)H-binding protein n=1 Tax=Solicola gregarius TaxID=2908642 RepID=A0AA46TIR1_9ACTN|nr:NAD(P)H-binding protein [Solicola gregarius]UYM05597.1 NAD(P)H-binding protein [Solicola gregarius]
MATIAIYGGNGYAGDAIRAEAVGRGHEVVAVSRFGSARSADAAAYALAGDIHDPVSVAQIAERADVVVVSIPGNEIEGKLLVEAIPGLLSAADRHGTRVGIVGGSGTLLASECGNRLMDTDDVPPTAMPSSKGQAAVLDLLHSSGVGSWFYVSPPVEFGAHTPQPPAGSYLLGGDVLRCDSNGESRLSVEDLALAVLDEIEQPKHENVRFSVIGAY